MVGTDCSFTAALRHRGGLGGEGQIEVFDKFGYDWMMNEVTAALAMGQLEKLEEQIERRRKIAELYKSKLSGVRGIRTLPDFEGCRNVYWKFITMLDENIDRDQVRARLRKEFMIEGGILYPTLCHLQPIYQNLGYKKGECPVAEKIMANQLTLPVNPYMTQEDVDYVVDSLDSIIHR